MATSRKCSSMKDLMQKSVDNFLEGFGARANRRDRISVIDKHSPEEGRPLVGIDGESEGSLFRVFVVLCLREVNLCWREKFSTIRIKLRDFEFCGATGARSSFAYTGILNF